jgi:hypothetical protein
VQLVVFGGEGRLGSLFAGDGKLFGSELAPRASLAAAGMAAAKASEAVSNERRSMEFSKGVCMAVRSMDAEATL